MRICLATNCSAIILLHYASCSCKDLYIGMLGANDLQGFVMTNHKLCTHETAFLSFMSGMRMSFAAWGHKARMVFAPLESPFSDKVVPA